MATRAENLAVVQRLREELTGLLDGMDYCLDWKEGGDGGVSGAGNGDAGSGGGDGSAGGGNDGGGWCAREIVYHLVDTPDRDGGAGSVIAGVLAGSRAEVTILPDANNITPARRAADIDAVRAAALEVLQQAEDAIAAAEDGDFEGRTAFTHLPARGIHETRTAQSFIDGTLARHWGEHLAQLRGVRAALGMQP